MEEERDEQQQAEPDPRPEEVERPKRGPDLGLYSEFRRLVAGQELLDGYVRALAKALKFSGEVRIEFQEGRVLWTELREKWVDWAFLVERLRED